MNRNEMCAFASAEYEAGSGDAQSGFTLLELIIVVIILTVITAASVPNLISYLANVHLGQAADALYGNMQHAKLRAVKENRSFAIVFDRGAGQYQVCSENGDGDWTTAADNTVEKTVTLADYASDVAFGHGDAGLAIGSDFGDDVTYASPDDVLVFNARGMSNSGYVYLNNGHNSAYGIGTRISGLVEMRRWAGSDWQ